MWPRGDATQGPGADMTTSRRTKNAGLSGFVSFMKRKDAEAALRELDGFDWGGSVLRVGWSKAVPIAAKPLYGTYASLHFYTASDVYLASHEETSFAIDIEIAFAESFTRTGVSAAFLFTLTFSVSTQGLRSRLALEAIEESLAQQKLPPLASRGQPSF